LRAEFKKVFAKDLASWDRVRTFPE
jgi:hypothetical protein